MRRPAVTIWRKGRISSGFSGPPNATSRTESKSVTGDASRWKLSEGGQASSPRGSSARHLVDHVHQRPHMIHRRLLVHALAEGRSEEHTAELQSHSNLP